MIQSKNYAGVTCVLVHKEDHVPCYPRQSFELRDGSVVILTGGSAPHKPSSTGRVFVQGHNYDQEFFPGVIGAEWIPETDLPDASEEV